jgi:hypothetical protein
MYIWDIEFTQGEYFSGDQFAREKFIFKKPVNEFGKWQFICDVPDSAPDDILRQEPNIIAVGSDLFLYTTDRSVSIPGISRRISTNNGVTWSSPTALAIAGLTENSQRPFVFTDPVSGKIYITYQRGGGLYISESTDGLNFTNSQSWQTVQADFTSIENSCITWDPDMSTYYGIIDGMKDGLWKTYVIAGSTIMTMVRLYNIESFYTALDNNGAYIVRFDGGGLLRKVNGVWHTWGHSSEIFRIKNSDITQDTWTLVYPNAPVFMRSSKWAQEQTADFSMVEKEGVCYAAINNCGDNYATTGNTSIYRYDGMTAQLFADLGIAIS